MPDLLEDLKLLVRTRHAVVTIQTPDEAYAVRMITQAGRELNMNVLAWSASDGLHRLWPTAGRAVGGTDTLAGTLKFMRGNNAQNVYILKDSLGQLRDGLVGRLLRDVAAEYAENRRTVFLVDAEGEPPAWLGHLAVPFDLAPPDRQEIADLVRTTLRDLSRSDQVVVDLNGQQLSQLAESLRGLSRTEVCAVLTRAALGDGRLSAEDLGKALDIKRLRLSRRGMLEYIPPAQTLPEVGGMGRLRVWLDKRAGAFTLEARQYGLDLPRGILMLGVQGCGKSMMARYVAALYRMPLLRLEVGALYDKYVGETERNLREAFRSAAAMAPCVLWIDEIEKAFASAGAGPDAARTDGGLSQRIFGHLLSWMQDRAEPIFIVATANDVSALPPELVRKGRFDEVFFVDLPSPGAREEIFRIHLARRKRDPVRFDLRALAAGSEGFSGAEIEQAVVSAMYAAFAEKRDLNNRDVLAEVSATRPLSTLMAEKVHALRLWAAERCVMAD